MLFVLVHSPSVGPATRSAVAGRLAGAGQAAVVPSLLAVGEGGPPFWPRVTAAVSDALAGTDAAGPLVLVAHSNAGVLVPVTREAITGEQPRLPLAYCEEQVPVPAGWQDHRCAYLLFGPPYDAQAREARRRGFHVRCLPGEHLHQVVDPGGVARALLGLAEGGTPMS
jgi:hypothetical protein